MRKLRWSGDIGYRDDERKTGITLSFVESELLSAGGDEIMVEFDTLGGDYFVGIQIMTMLKEYKGKKTIKFGAIVASAGTAVALGFDKRIARKTSSFMIHNAQSGTWGDQNDLRKTAEQLEAWSRIIADEYSIITGKPIEEITKMMDDETWLYGQEIVDFGFADEMEESVNDLTVMNKAQAIALYKKNIDIRNRATGNTKKPETIRDFESHLRDVGYSKSQATAIASVGFRAIVEKKEENMDKELVIAYLKTGAIPSTEVINALGSNVSLKSDEEKALLVSLKAEGITDPLKEIKELRVALLAVDSDRVASILDKEFGAPSDINPVRMYASEFFKGSKSSELTQEKFVEFKASPIAKNLAAQMVDAGSDINRINEKQQGDKKNVTVKNGIKTTEV